VNCRAGFVWAAPQHFNRFIEDCGISCELVTPHMLAAPFYRPTLNCLIVPTGFANPAYSNLLPALRASSSRIRRFVENGGSLLVFGSAADRPDAYDWLPFHVSYRHEYRPRSIACTAGATGTCARALIADYDPAAIECDGTFPEHDGDSAGTCESEAVVIAKHVGKGTIVVTSVHEYPSRQFLKTFCTEGQLTTL
jgi:glutamine amidotransferase-like uncharacterized protein